MRKWTKAYGGREGESGKRKVRKRRQEREKERKKTLARDGEIRR